MKPSRTRFFPHKRAATAAIRQIRALVETRSHTAASNPSNRALMADRKRKSRPTHVPWMIRIMRVASHESYEGDNVGRVWTSICSAGQLEELGRWSWAYLGPTTPWEGSSKGSVYMGLEVMGAARPHDNNLQILEQLAACIAYHLGDPQVLIQLRLGSEVREVAYIGLNSG